MKNLQHRIQVNIAKKNGTKEAVVGSCIRRVPAKLIINLLFGEARESVVLKPGETVRSVIINEVKGEEVNG